MVIVSGWMVGLCSWYPGVVILHTERVSVKMACGPFDVKFKWGEVYQLRCQV